MPPPSYELICRQLHFDSWAHDKPLADLRFGTDIPRGNVSWLWPDRSPLARRTLLAAAPGVRTPPPLADIAARHSAGLPFPPLVPKTEPTTPVVGPSLVRESGPPLTPPPGVKGLAPRPPESLPAK